MNYRHAYHAGNFADVIKHIVLIELISHFQKKETGFCCLDTHAGIGLYDLQAAQAQKKQEYSNGIQKLFLNAKESMPDSVQKYIAIIEHYNHGDQLSFYPGSPVISADLLRPQDRLILTELHTEDYQTLKNYFKGNKQVAVHHQDAYLGMKAFLPPKEKRGFALIDPPFEVTDEFSRITAALKLALTHWSSGCYCVWYPIKNTTAVDDFLKTMAHFPQEKCAFHFSIDTAVKTTALEACGILILNPPWQLKAHLLDTVIPYLAENLQNGHFGRCVIV